MNWDKAIWAADEAVEGVGQMLQTDGVNVNIPAVTGVRYISIPYGSQVTYIGSGIATILCDTNNAAAIEIDGNEEIRNLRPASKQICVFFSKSIKISKDNNDSGTLPTLVLFTNFGGG